MTHVKSAWKYTKSFLGLLNVYSADRMINVPSNRPKHAKNSLAGQSPDAGRSRNPVFDSKNFDIFEIFGMRSFLSSPLFAKIR